VLGDFDAVTCLCSRHDDSRVRADRAFEGDLRIRVRNSLRAIPFTLSTTFVVEQLHEIARFVGT
jgi:hypothetical protein